MVWADEQPEQTTASELHTNYRLKGSQGFTALSRMLTGFPSIIDYINYPATLTDQSYGVESEGNPWPRALLQNPTPLTSNITVEMAAPNIVLFSVADGKLTLSWTTVPGLQYRIEYRDTLQQGDWIPLTNSMNSTGTMNSTGDRLSFSINLEGSVHRFYRIAQIK